MLATRFIASVVILGSSAVWPVTAGAQQVVVQQPEFRQFAVPTTVIVPDRGAAMLGGTSGAGRAQSVFGPVPMARSGTVGSGSSTVQVRAYVHDFQAMDEALLGQAQRPTPVTGQASRKAESPFRGLPRVHAANKGQPLAHMRADVEAALRAEATAASSADHAASIRHLIVLHDRIVADPRHATNVSVRGLGRRVGIHLVDTHDKLKVEATAAGGNAAEAQALIDLIQATISPETWNINGGRGSIVYFANGHALVVSAPGNVHDDLGGLLRQLR